MASFSKAGRPVSHSGGRHPLLAQRHHSSAAVGCSAMVASKSALVAPILSAIAATCTISAASAPEDVAADDLVGLAVDQELHEHNNSSRPESVCFRGRKRALKTSSFG